MIIIIDLDHGNEPNHYVRFSHNATQVVLSGTWPVIGRFEVLGRDDDDEANVIRELPHDWRPEDKVDLMIADKKASGIT